MTGGGDGRMKAQAVFEFIIASMILFSIIIYTISYLSSSFAMHHGIAGTADLEAKAMRISDILASDNKIGIFSTWPNLSVSKMNILHTTCNDATGDGYFRTIGRFGLNESSPSSKYNRLQIMVVGADKYVYVNCGRVPVGKVASGYVTRFGFVPGAAPGSGQLAQINVSVW
jgi:hypothetical protein